MKLNRLFISTLFLLIVLLAAFPSAAISNASINFTGGHVAYDYTTCDHANLLYTGSATGTTFDVGTLDAFAIIMVDGNGIVLDNDIWYVHVGSTMPIDDFTDFGMIHSVTARPVTIRLVDIGDADGVNENTPEGVAITLAGTVLSENVIDPADVFAPCASLPKIESQTCLPIPPTAVVGDLPFETRAYYSPGNLSTVTLNAGTYWVLGVDQSAAFYKIILGCQYLWVPVGSMQPSYQPPQNGTPLPTIVVS